MNTGRNLDVICGALLMYMYAGADLQAVSAGGATLELRHKEIIQVAALLLFGWFWLRHNQRYLVHEIMGAWTTTAATLSDKSLRRWCLLPKAHATKISQHNSKPVIGGNPVSRRQFFTLTLRMFFPLIWTQPKIADVVVPSAIAWVTLIALLVHNFHFPLHLVSAYWFG